MMDVDPPFRLVTPDGRWTIEVTEHEGQFRGIVVLDGDTVTEAMQTADSDTFIRWATKQMH
jgi:hypothetical protein